MKRFWIGLLAPLSAGLTVLAHRHPQATERWFSQGIYRVFTETYGRVFGYLPFSAAQFLVILLPVAATIYVVLEIIGTIKGPYRKKRVSRLAANVSCGVGVLFFMYTMLCGLNYARVEFGELVGLEIRPTPVAELVSLGEELAQQVSELSYAVNRDEQGRMIIFAESNFVLAQNARYAFRLAAKDHPILDGFVPLPKPILYSRFMSRLNIGGIYMPFTMEAHVNVHMPDYHIPAIMIHELAHFRGIMREDEANFIAWYISKQSGDIDFMYSGAMLAFVHTMNQLRRVSREDWQRIWSGVSEGVLIDIAANREYWRQFEGPLTEISTAANDAYLRANRQEDGVASYGRMVDLLLAYFREEL